MSKHKPMRRCAGCREAKPQDSLYRIAYYEGSLVFDRSGKAKGRGVYLCKNAECIAQAKKKNALQRSFRTKLAGEQVERLFEEIENEQEQGS